MTCDQLNLQMRGPARALFFLNKNITSKKFLQNFFHNPHRGFPNSRYFHFHLVRPYLFFLDIVCVDENYRKQSHRGVPRKRCSENIQQSYRKTPMSKCDFNKVALIIFKVIFMMLTYSKKPLR